jgi:hypothetical protein
MGEEEADADGREWSQNRCVQARNIKENRSVAMSEGWNCVNIWPTRLLLTRQRWRETWVKIE